MNEPQMDIFRYSKSKIAKSCELHNLIEQIRLNYAQDPIIQ